LKGPGCAAPIRVCTTLIGHTCQAVEIALGYIASGRFRLRLMATHRFGLADVDLAIRSVGGEGTPGAIHVTVLPWLK